MNHKIRLILDQIAALQDELNDALQEQGTRLRYQFEGKRVVFEKAIQEAHQRVQQGVFRWFLSIPLRNFLTMPFIYGMVVPLLLLDFFVCMYQLVCFPIYGIARASRSDYLVLDHQHLAYLNLFEKFHCVYCSYAVGLLAFASEVTARTEQYFCPIKHAAKILGAHSRYERFLEYGEAEDYHGKLDAYRAELAGKADRPEPPQCGESPR